MNHELVTRNLIYEASHFLRFAMKAKRACYWYFYSFLFFSLLYLSRIPCSFYYLILLCWSKLRVLTFRTWIHESCVFYLFDDKTTAEYNILRKKENLPETLLFSSHTHTFPFTCFSIIFLDVLLKRFNHETGGHSHFRYSYSIPNISGR